MSMVSNKLKEAIDKTVELFEENTLQKGEIKTYKQRDECAKEIQKKYQDLLETVKDKEKDEEENYDLAALIQNGQSGGRRSGPASAPMFSQVVANQNMEPETHDCSLCDFKARKEGILKEHIKSKHHECDLCARVLKTPDKLRTHLEVTHNKEAGTLLHCDVCQFSALSSSHLKLHKQKHHSKQSCRQCDFKTSHGTTALMEHVAVRHRRTRGSTCKYWLQNKCTRANCKFLHKKPEDVNCKFGRNCRNGQSCQYKHDQSGQNKSAFLARGQTVRQRGF